MKISVLLLDKLKQDNRAAPEPPQLECAKQFLLCADKKIKETEQGLQVDFVISTGAIDREQDTIEVEGWALDNYAKNPVILWAHDYSRPPVAKSLKVWVEDGLLKSTALFMTKEISGFGYSVGQMYANGFLNAVSVGFRSLSAKWAADQENRPYGIDFMQQELLEYSCVPVPANPEALIAAKSAGIDVSYFYEWAVECLESGSGEIPQQTAEKIYNLLKTHSSFAMPQEITGPQKSGLLIYERNIKINESRGKLLC